MWNGAGDLATVKGQAQTLMTKLLPLHGPDTYLDSLSIRNVVTRRLAYHKIYIDKKGTAYGTGDRSDYPTTSILLKFTNNSTGAVVNQHIRGLPDSVCEAGGFYDPNPLYLPVMAAFLGYLESSSDPWQLKINNPANPHTNITGVSDAGVITAVGHGLADGDQVRVSGVTGRTWVNGLWKVVSSTTDTFMLDKAIPPTPNPDYTGGGTVQLKTPLYVAIDVAEVDGCSEHRVGRPSEVLTGRRKTRRK